MWRKSFQKPDCFRRAVRRRRRVRGYGVHNYRETASELCAYLWFYTRVQDPWIFVINCKQFSEVRAIRSTEQYYSTVVSPLLLACYISVYPYFGQFSSKKYRVQKFSYSGNTAFHLRFIITCVVNVQIPRTQDTRETLRRPPGSLSGLSSRTARNTTHTHVSASFCNISC